MIFYVGQKVVCVDNGPTPGRAGWLADIPQTGEVYTIEAFLEVEGEPGFILKEIKNTEYWGFSYAARRFRPVVERKTDISIFTKMLDRTPSHESA